MGILETTWPMILLRFFDLAMLIAIPSIIMYYFVSYQKEHANSKVDTKEEVHVNVKNMKDYKRAD